MFQALQFWVLTLTKTKCKYTAHRMKCNSQTVATVGSVVNYIPACWQLEAVILFRKCPCSIPQRNIFLPQAALHELHAPTVAFHFVSTVQTKGGSHRQILPLNAISQQCTSTWSNRESADDWTYMKRDFCLKLKIAPGSFHKDLNGVVCNYLCGLWRPIFFLSSYERSSYGDYCSKASYELW